MKYKDLEDEWTELWNRMILDALENPSIFKPLICYNNSILTDNALPPRCEDISVKNHMEKGHDCWISEQRSRHIKAFQIQRHWRLCSCNPEYKLAQRCLLRLHRT